MNAEQFMWWMGGVLSLAPTDSNLATKAQALDTIRAQLVSVLVDQQLSPGLSVPKHSHTTTLVYPPGVRGNHRAQVVDYYEQQTQEKQQQAMAQQAAIDANSIRNLSSFGAIPAPEDEARDMDALMIERGYQPKGQ